MADAVAQQLDRRRHHGDDRPGRGQRAQHALARPTRTFLALAGSAAAIGLLISGLSAALSNDLTEEGVRSFVIVDTSGFAFLRRPRRGHGGPRVRRR